MPEPDPPPGTRWTDQEDALLLARPDDSLAELAAALGRPIPAVARRRLRLRGRGALAGGHRPRWTAEEDAVVLASRTLTAGDLAARLGRSVDSVAWRRKALGAGPGRGRPGLGDPKPPPTPRPRPWSAAEDALLLAEPVVPAKELAPRLGRTVGAVHRRRSDLRKSRGAPYERRPGGGRRRRSGGAG